MRCEHAPSASDRAALRGAQAVPGVPRQRGVERVERVGVEIGKRCVELAAQRAIEPGEVRRDRRATRARCSNAARRTGVTASKSVGRAGRRALGRARDGRRRRRARRAAVRTAPTAAARPRRAAPRRRRSGCAPTGRHAGPRRDLVHARAQDAVLVAREQRVDDRLAVALPASSPARRRLRHGHHSTLVAAILQLVSSDVPAPGNCREAFGDPAAPATPADGRSDQTRDGCHSAAWTGVRFWRDDERAAHHRRYLPPMLNPFEPGFFDDPYAQYRARARAGPGAPQPDRGAGRSSATTTCTACCATRACASRSGTPTCRRRRTRPTSQAMLDGAREQAARTRCSTSTRPTTTGCAGSCRRCSRRA